MTEKIKNGEIVMDRILGTDSPEKKLFMVVWQRSANSGIVYCYAKDEEDALNYGWSPKHCLLTIVEINRDSMPVQYGVQA